LKKEIKKKDEEIQKKDEENKKLKEEIIILQQQLKNTKIADDEKSYNKLFTFIVF
jgi:hypothetical protein